MRVLVVANFPLLPATAGNRARVARLVEHLETLGWEVGLVLLPDLELATWDVEGMRRRYAFVEVAAPPGGALGRRLRRLAARLAARLGVGGDGAGPFAVDAWCPGWFRARVAAAARRWRPDVVLVVYVYLTACFERLAALDLPPWVGVLDTQDVMHRRAAVYAAAGVPLQWFHTTPEEERRGLARADLVLAIQEEEARVLGALVPGRPVLVVPHAMPVRPAPLAAALPGRVLAVASHNDVNVAGLAWLFAAVWTAVRARVPAAELVVCGTVAGKLGVVPAGVVVRGAVPDLTAEYAAARVVVSPVASGTGLKVKVAEALCHGRPVVATGAGAAGIAVGEATGVVVADDPEAFAAALIDLLTDEARWARLAAAAAAHAARALSPEAVFGPLAARLTDEVARRRRG